MLFGTSKDIITPISKMKLACPGGNFDDEFVSIHDDVYVRCLAMDDGKSKAVFLSYDLLFHDRSLNNAMEAYAGEKYGIKSGALVISYTHAHTSPASLGYNPGAHDDNYEAFLLERSKNCLDRAMCAMFEGTIEYGSFNADYNVSRRGSINGVPANAPNYNYEHDTKMNILCVKDVSGKIRSIFMNYACHPVFYPAKRTICGEFPARLCQYIDMKYFGCTSLFFQSAGADVRPGPTANDIIGSNASSWKVDLGFKGVDDFAKCISDGVSGFVDCNAMKKTTLSIDAVDFDIELEMEPAPISYFEEMFQVYKNSDPNPNKNNVEYILFGGYDKLSNTMPLHCQAIRLSDDLYIATCGGEPCYGVEKAILAAFGDKTTFFIGYTDACAYIVDDVVLKEGGYEPTCHLEYRLIGPFKPGLNKLYTENFKSAFDKISK